MDAIDHPRVTRRFGAPVDWSPQLDGPCGTLEIADVDASGRKAMESLWRPDAEEMKALAEGGAIVLTIMGTVHPIVSMGVTGPEFVGSK